MTLLRRLLGGIRLPLAVLVVASVVTVTITGALGVPAGAQDSSTTVPPTTTPPTTAPPTEPADPGDPGPVLGPHDGDLSEVPLDPDAPPDLEALEPVDPAAPPILLRDPTPHIRVLLAELGVMDARVGIPEAQQALDQVNADLANRRLELAAAEERLGAAKNRLAASRRAMSDFAVRSYIFSNGGESTGPIGDVYEQRKGEQLSGAVLEHQTELIEGARQGVIEADGAIIERQNAVRAAEAVVGEREADLQFVTSILDTAQEELATARSLDVDKLFDPEVDSGRATRKDPDRWQLTLAGQSTFTVEELQAWFRQWKVAPQASVSGDELAKHYVEEGNLENIRGDVMLAQAIWETGTFSNRDTRLLNNFAGIGHCDSCPEGFGFDSAQMGVRGQAQLLKSYVEVNPTLATPLLDRRLRGPAGCCQTWNQLTGIWASDMRYGPLILGLYEDMLEWLVLTRAAGGIPASAP